MSCHWTKNKDNPQGCVGMSIVRYVIEDYMRESGRRSTQQWLGSVLTETPRSKRMDHRVSALRHVEILSYDEWETLLSVTYEWMMRSVVVAARYSVTSVGVMCSVARVKRVLAEHIKAQTVVVTVCAKSTVVTFSNPEAMQHHLEGVRTLLTQTILYVFGQPPTDKPSIARKYEGGYVYRVLLSTALLECEFGRDHPLFQKLRRKYPSISNPDVRRNIDNLNPVLLRQRQRMMDVIDVM